MTELVNTILDHVFTNKKLIINIPRMNDDEKKVFFKNLIYCLVYCIKTGTCDIYIKSKFNNRVTLNNILMFLTENYVYIKSINIKPRVENELFVVVDKINNETIISKDEYHKLLKEYYKLKCKDDSDKHKISEIYSKLNNYCQQRELMADEYRPLKKQLI